MRSLESRIDTLERTAPGASLPAFMLEFIKPGCGTVALSNLRTGHTIERCDDESEAQFLSRAGLKPEGRR